MRSYKLILLLGLSVAALLVGTAGLQVQSQNRATKAVQENSRAGDLPTVVYAASESPDTDKRIQREAKGERYNGRKIVAEPYPEAGAVGILDSWVRKLPAFPVSASDAVVIGEITEAQAHLSPDKTGVYTAYSVLASEVLIQSADAPIAPGSVVETQREGGRVLFPSGRSQSYVTHYQGVPRVGRRYVLFLKRNEKGGAFYILTGYELKAGRVYPLDGVDLPGGATEVPQFAAYKGADETTFSSALRNAIAQPEQAPNK